MGIHDNNRSKVSTPSSSYLYPGSNVFFGVVYSSFRFQVWGLRHRDCHYDDPTRRRRYFEGTGLRSILMKKEGSRSREVTRKRMLDW